MISSCKIFFCLLCNCNLRLNSFIGIYFWKLRSGSSGRKKSLYKSYKNDFIMIRYIQPRFFTTLHRSSQLKPSTFLLSKLDLYRNAHERLIASRILVSPICQPYIYTRSFHISSSNLKNVSSRFTNFVWILYFNYCRKKQKLVLFKNSNKWLKIIGMS